MMKKYSKIRRLGHKRNEDMLSEGKITIKEKIDGANLRFTVTEDGEFLFGSKNVEYSDEEGNPVYEGEVVDDRFKPAINHIREKLDVETVKYAYGTKYTYFLEASIPHSLEYDSRPEVIAFDIYDEEQGRYLSTKSAYDRFVTLNFETAPVLDRVSVEEFDPEDYEIPESDYRDGKMEGVVLINESKEEDGLGGFSTRAKMLTEEFKEKHKKATGARQSAEAVKGHEKIVSKYCTDGRIRKHIHKMQDRGRDLGMQLMEGKDGVEGLPMRVSIDILQEEASEIVRRNDEMEFKKFRSLVADRCVRVLRQEIHKNSL